MRRKLEYSINVVEVTYESPKFAIENMVEVQFEQEQGNDVVVELRDPYWAAFVAWIWPGAGHFYQRRYAKGFLFMICVLSTFFYGLGLGRGRCVYASFKKGDFRWQYICQLGTGAVALPAIAQTFKTSGGGDPYFVLCERYAPTDQYPENDPKAYYIVEDESYSGKTLKDGFMAPPAGRIYQDVRDTLGMWHFEMKHKFDIGTLYCVVAGLLNMLVIYDAFAGPAILTREERERLEAKKKKKNRRQRE